MSRKIFVVFGTRPEAIKLAPVIKALSEHDFKVSTVLFRQHGAMLDEALAAFGVKPTHDLGVIFSDKAIFGKGINIISRLVNLAKGGVGFFRFLWLLRRERPDLLIVQGDTSTAFLAALCAFYFRIPVGHVEAGLRTHDRRNPFPEETNRELIARLADIHFAPTEGARENLLREGIQPETIHVTGNTAIDALLSVLEAYEYDAERKKKLDALLSGKCGVKIENGKRLVLLTAHRRESFGEPLREMFGAAKDIAEKYPDVQIVYPVHPNPNVERVAKEILGGVAGITLTSPISYEPFVVLMKRAYLILTDSGGIQEEASVLGKPILVMREKTERAEALQTNAKLIGRSRKRIVNEASALLSDPAHYAAMAKPHYAFGKGDAAEKIALAIADYLK